MDQTTKKFLAGFFRSFNRLENGSGCLKGDHDRQKGLECIFRTIHTIMRTSKALDLEKLEAAANIGGNLPGKLRDSVTTFNSGLERTEFATVDTLRRMLGQIEVGGNPDAQEYSNLIALLTRLQIGASTEGESVESHANAPMGRVAVAG